MIIEFLVICGLLLIAGVIIGIILSDHPLAQEIPEKAGIVGVVGVILGVVILVIGIFTDSGQQEVRSYEDWRGLTVNYLSDVPADEVWLGLFICALSVIGGIIFVLGTSLGQLLIGKIEEKNALMSVEEIFRRKRRIKVLVTVMLLLSTGIITARQLYLGVAQHEKYEVALAAYETGNYQDAMLQYKDLGDYKDSKHMEKLCEAKTMSQFVDKKQMVKAEGFINQLKDYVDGNDDIGEATREAYDKYYDYALDTMKNGNYEEAEKLFSGFDRIYYKDSLVYENYSSSMVRVVNEDGPVNISMIYNDAVKIETESSVKSPISKYLSEIASFEGEWKCVECLRSDDADYSAKVTSYFALSDYNLSNPDIPDGIEKYLFVVYNGKLYCVEEEDYNDWDRVVPVLYELKKTGDSFVFVESTFNDHNSDAFWKFERGTFRSRANE